MTDLVEKLLAKPRTPLKIRAAHRIKTLEAEVARLTQERDAATAAAYEAAGETAAEFIHRRLYEANMPVCSYHSRDIKTAIRALATPDQTAALYRVRAEAKAEGILTAARITRVEAERLPISLHDAALKCEAAILAATPKEGV